MEFPKEREDRINPETCRDAFFSPPILFFSDRLKLLKVPYSPLCGNYRKIESGGHAEINVTAARRGFFPFSQVLFYLTSLDYL